MKTKELREKTDKELTDLLSTTSDGIRILRFKVASKEAKNVRDLRKEKKQVARIHTLMAERKKV
ncbi:MAG: 50S ribosomal protein L29 [Patescibacteria group bacterium]